MTNDTYMDHREATRNDGQGHCNVAFQNNAPYSFASLPHKSEKDNLIVEL